MEKDPVKSFLGEFEDNSFQEQFGNVEEQPVEQTEPEKVEEEPRTRRNLPFSEDPKVQRYVKKEIAKALADHTPAPVAQVDDEETKDVVSAFTDIIGNDTPEKQRALKALERALGNVDQRASQIALQQIEQIRNQELQADQEAEEELTEAFDTIEDTFGVDLTNNRKLRTEFVTFVEKIAPKDRNGDIIDYPDMISAFETFNDMRKGQPNRSKELASRSMSRSSETVPVQQKKVDWNAVDEMLDGLK